MHNLPTGMVSSQRDLRKEYAFTKEWLMAELNMALI